MTVKVKYIACDFDGTLTQKDAWPAIAKENPCAVEVIKKLRKAGNKIILHTCRQGQYLNDAIEWMKSRGIEPDAVNDNPRARELYGEPGPKMFADYYIDDHSLGIPKTKTGAVDFKWIKKNYNKLFN